MKILIVGDIHLSVYSSIVRSRGDEFSTRLENCLLSIDWVERLAEARKVDMIVYLGDFFDKAELNSEEITALPKIQWAEDIWHTFLVGNHETGSANLLFNTVRYFANVPHSFVVDRVNMMQRGKYIYYFFPYILNQEERDFSRPEYGMGLNDGHTIVFSHNDIKGVQYGGFESKEGFEVDDIHKYCQLFINGHIHNGGYVDKEKRILNLGNLTGQNFNEDGFVYKHNAVLLTVDEEKETITQEFLPNTFALSFYKLEYLNDDQFEADLQKTELLSRISAITVRCLDANASKARALIEKHPYIIAHRIVTYTERQDLKAEDMVKDLNIDHIQQFSKYILEKLGSSEDVKAELQEILV